VPDRRPRFKARFIWNERQVLFDQAVLAGVAADSAVSEPVSNKAFGEMYSMYSREEVGGLLPPKGAQPIEQRIPPDLFWLFRKSVWMDLVPFSGPGEAAVSGFRQAASKQVMLTRELISLCLLPFTRQHVFRSIRDTSGIVARHVYVIDTFKNP
jgi:hypothetical protein